MKATKTTTTKTATAKPAPAKKTNTELFLNYVEDQQIMFESDLEKSKSSLVMMFVEVGKTMKALKEEVDELRDEVNALKV